MRILLTSLNSKYVHSNLALKYLYASALDTRVKIKIKEFTINNEDDYIFNEMLLGEYDIICFSCYVWNIEKTLVLCDNLKKAAPGLKLALGGPEVTFDSLDIIRGNRNIDFIMRGEGEKPFRELCKIWERDTPSGYERVGGLVYRENGKIFVNPEGECTDFDEIPFPYNYFSCEDDKVIYYESSRGCPYSCSYCMSSLDRRMRSLPVERVKMDLSYFIRKRVKQVKLLDRTFNWDKERCYVIFKYLMAMDNGVTNFHFEMCGDLIDDKLLTLLKGARKGLFQFEIGIQSTNARTLTAVSRNPEVKQIFSNVKAVMAGGNVHMHVDLIAGLPFEDYSIFKQSFNHVYALKADTLQLGFLKMLKGTVIRENAHVYDYVYREKAPYEIISNTFISAKDIAGLKRIEALLDMYYNRGGFKRTLEFLIEQGAQTPFDFYEEFAVFYYLRGYQHRPHKKEDLYRIIYKYAMWKDRSAGNLCEGVAEFLEADMDEALNFDAVKKFKRKGWDLS